MKHYKVIINNGTHNFEIGEIIQLTHNKNEYLNTKGYTWYLREEEVEFAFETIKTFKIPDKFVDSLVESYQVIGTLDLGFKWFVGKTDYCEQEEEIDAWLAERGVIDGEAVYLEC